MMTMTMTTMIMTTTVVMMIRKSSLHVSFVSLWLLLLWPPICVEGPSRSSIDRAEETHSDQQLDSSLRLIPSFLPLRWTSATRPLYVCITHVCMHMHACIHACMHVRTDVRTYVCMYVCRAYVCMFVCLGVCMCAFM